ncbi:MAG: ADP-ribosylglycohydrolase family protein [Verrucomicrobia bacterium]|nr:ADP-ribosylglycohydrolase family protein [Verrucomicrobiota bacterium]MCH8527885.1 ADP-ribosylglycohydrolase family protein [Kiritimatiellia bacterium]
MYGAVAGDMIGSVYENDPVKTKDFPLFSPQSCFTDDTVLTLGVAKAILEGLPYRDALWSLGRAYPLAGYGQSFFQWLHTRDPQPYQSWGNGSAMRVSPIGYAFDTEEEVLWHAKASAAVSHDHPEGVKGAQAVALAVYLARKGADKETLRNEIGGRFGYDLNRTLEEIRPGYAFDVSCQGSVPEALIAFLDSDSFEDAVRNAVSLGGDSDTLACMAGAVAEAFYRRISPSICAQVKKRLPAELLGILEAFVKAHGPEHRGTTLPTCVYPSGRCPWLTGCIPLG